MNESIIFETLELYAKNISGELAQSGTPVYDIILRQDDLQL